MEYGTILPSMEVLFVNLIALDRCLRRKHSIFRTVAVLAAFTACFLLCFTLLPNGAFYGNGELSILGFLYLIPLKLLYDEKLETMFLVACMSWTYTLGILAISVQTALLLERLDYGLVLTVAETALFLATFRPFQKHLVPRYSYIIRSGNLVKTARFIHFKASIYLNFFLLNVLHHIFLDSRAYVLQIAALVMFLALNYFFYRIVYEIISGSLKIDKLKIQASSDVLTGLGNRAQAAKDLRRLMEDKRTFSLVFLDLDRFKLVNDTYGHDVGDRYLLHFAQVFTEELADNGTLYRFGGDEFLAIYHGVLTEESVGEMAQCKKWDEGAPCSFNEVSVGLVVCEPPYGKESQDDLVKQADSIMYRNKASRRSEHAGEGSAG